MSTITRMTRYGRNYKIVLDCGHILLRTTDEVKLQQLHLEKQMGCDHCSLEAAQTEAGYDQLPGASADARTSMEEFRRKLSALEKSTRGEA